VREIETRGSRLVGSDLGAWRRFWTNYGQTGSNQLVGRISTENAIVFTDTVSLGRRVGYADMAMQQDQDSAE
jgi:hypothetical protein